MRPGEPIDFPWEELWSLLDDAIALEDPDRAAFVGGVKRRDPDLGRRLAEALDGAATHSFLEGDVVGFVGPAWIEEPAAGLVPGSRIGPYRIRERLAVGGMSLVYLIERDDDQFDRQAVLKVLEQVGLDPGEAIRRFEAEKQILAALDHPNIASVFDGGVTEDGRPYLILEYVPGEPVTEYCARLALPIRKRIELFETICAAVHHAHERFVVHRDLKPSNILVREDGVPKLLDFGIAKLLDSDFAKIAPVTRTEMRLLTPEYAAPEQIRGETITSATDVYGLGVLLFELLSGRRPYSLQGETPSRVEKIICEESPERPSVAVLRGDGATAGLSADALSRRLRGDLDTIVLKALRKEPGARYSSPRDLAEDLRRHRQGLPIVARSASVGYLLRRRVQRHRWGLAGAMAAIAFFAFHLVRITEERNHARREQVKAEEVSSFLRELFEVSDPDVSQGRDVTARDLLARAARRIRSELTEQPEIRADMLLVLGDVHRRLSLYEEAAPFVEEAYRIHGERGSRGRAEAAASLETLGFLRLEMGNYRAADSLLEASLEDRRALFGREHPEVASAWHALGVSALNQNQYDRADSVLHEALRIQRSHPQSERLQLATTLKDLGMVQTAKGDLSAAEPLLREALEIRRQELGGSNSEVLIAMTNLGDNLSLQGRFDEAVPLLQEGTEGLERILGDSHSEVAEGLNVLGITLIQSGRYDEAETALTRALEIREKIHGEKHPDYARGLNDLSAAYMYRADFVRAEPLLRESLEINRQLLGDESLEVAINYSNLARALRAIGRYDEALACYEKAESTYVRSFGPSHARTLGIALGRARVAHERGDLDRAEAAYRELVGPMREAYPRGGPRLASLLTSLGRLLVSGDRAEEALPLLMEGESMYLEIRGAESMETAQARIALARGLFALGRYQEAEPLLVSGLAVEERFLPPRHERLISSWELAGRLYTELGRPEEARVYLGRLTRG